MKDLIMKNKSAHGANIAIIEEKRKLCQELGGVLGLPEALEPRVLAAAHQMLDEGSVSKVVLYGEPEKILKVADAHSIKLRQMESNLAFVGGSAVEGAVGDAFEAEMVRRGNELNAEKRASWAKNELAHAAFSLQQGEVDAVVCGAVAKTSDVIRAGLYFIGLEPKIKTLSGCFFLLHPDRVALNQILFADSAVTIEPSEEQIFDIATESVRTWRAAKMQQDPCVAFLSFSTHGSGNHPSATKMQNAARRFAHTFPEVTCDGEIQFDAAVDAAIGARKCPESKLPGKANIFIFPNIDAGNIAYKMMQRVAGYIAVGPILQGLRLPYSDLSRGASVEDIVYCSYFNLLRASR